MVGGPLDSLTSIPKSSLSGWHSQFTVVECASSRPMPGSSLRGNLAHLCLESKWPRRTQKSDPAWTERGAENDIRHLLPSLEAAVWGLTADAGTVHIASSRRGEILNHMIWLTHPSGNTYFYHLIIWNYSDLKFVLRCCNVVLGGSAMVFLVIWGRQNLRLNCINL